MARMKETILTIKALQRAGIPVTPGNQCIPRRLLPKRAPSLMEIRRRLAKFKGSLAEEIARLREIE